MVFKNKAEFKMSCAKLISDNLLDVYQEIAKYFKKFSEAPTEKKAYLKTEIINNVFPNVILLNFFFKMILKINDFEFDYIKKFLSANEQQIKNTNVNNVILMHPKKHFLNKKEFLKLKDDFSTNYSINFVEKDFDLFNDFWFGEFLKRESDFRFKLFFQKHFSKIIKNIFEKIFLDEKLDFNVIGEKYYSFLNELLFEFNDWKNKKISAIEKIDKEKFLFEFKNTLNQKNILIFNIPDLEYYKYSFFVSNEITSEIISNTASSFLIMNSNSKFSATPISLIVDQEIKNLDELNLIIKKNFPQDELKEEVLMTESVLTQPIKINEEQETTPPPTVDSIEPSPIHELNDALTSELKNTPVSTLEESPLNKSNIDVISKKDIANQQITKQSEQKITLKENPKILTFNLLDQDMDFTLSLDKEKGFWQELLDSPGDFKNSVNDDDLKKIVDLEEEDKKNKVQINSNNNKKIIKDDLDFNKEISKTKLLEETPQNLLKWATYFEYFMDHYVSIKDNLKVIDDPIDKEKLDEFDAFVNSLDINQTYIFLKNNVKIVFEKMYGKKINKMVLLRLYSLFLHTKAKFEEALTKMALVRG